MYNEGISKIGDILDLGVLFEVVTKRGAFFSYKETRLGQGRENAKEFLKNNPQLAEEIDQEVRATKLGDAALLASNTPETDLDESADGEF